MLHEAIAFLLLLGVAVVSGGLEARVIEAKKYRARLGMRPAIEFNAYSLARIAMATMLLTVVLGSIILCLLPGWGGSPIFYLALAIITILLWLLGDWIERQNIQRMRPELDKLAEEIKRVFRAEVLSKGWDRKWRQQELAEMAKRGEAFNEEKVLKNWQARAGKTFKEEADLAQKYFFIDRKRIIHLFTLDNEEEIKRWAMLTKNPIPRW